MKMMKFFAFALALLLSSTLISCSNEDKKEGAETTTASGVETPADTDDATEEEEADPILNPAGNLPSGSVYHVRGEQEDIIAADDGSTPFPAEVRDSDIFYYGDYIYTYTDGVLLGGEAGWTVTVNDEKKNEAILTAVLESINGLPIVSMNACFKDCINLQFAPAIPDTVYTMTRAFYGCSNLTAAPVIPESVKYFDAVFYGCLSLKGEVEINATPESFDECFTATGYELTLTGACENKADLAATGAEGMITY